MLLVHNHVCDVRYVGHIGGVLGEGSVGKLSESGNNCKEIEEVT